MPLKQFPSKFRSCVNAMKLANPFPQSVRILFLYCYQCFACGRSDRGLELHHIVGRSSSSAFNAIPLCPYCHSKVGHTEDEERYLFSLVLPFLFQVKFQPLSSDYDFLLKNHHLIQGKEIEKWLNS